MVQLYAELVGRDLIVLADGSAAPEDLALAAKHLQQLTPLYTQTKPAGALSTPITWPAVVQLQAAFGEYLTLGPALAAWVGDQIAVRSQPSVPSVHSGPAGLTYPVPAGLTPYPWQVEGAQIIANLGHWGGALITDEPGTGKTATTILGLVERWARDGYGRHPWPVVVVCPASVVDPWVDAWRTWAPGVEAVAWRGTPKNRHALAGTADVYVTSYDLARIDTPPSPKRGELAKINPAAVVIDECHQIKNSQTQRSQAVRRLAAHADVVIALSGTPITHHPGDLWPTLNAMTPDSWPSRERWVRRYCNVLPGDYGTGSSGDEILGLLGATEPEFRLTLLGQHRRVAKADVLTQLPPKVYSVRTVELPAAWRKAYDDMETKMLAELPGEGSDPGAELSVMSTLALLTRLSQLASAPADVTVTHGPETNEITGEPKEHVTVTLKPTSWKVEALLEILAERGGPGEGEGEPVACFAPSRQLMQLAGQAATEAGYRVGYVVGGQAAGVRSATIKAFQAGELDLICVTTAAGGVGITLTAARTAVFLQRPWSLVESVQAEDRCHRIGSERHDTVEIIDVVAKSTIDTRVRAVLRERAGQLSELLQDPRIAAELLGGSRTPDHTDRKAS